MQLAPFTAAPPIGSRPAAPTGARGTGSYIGTLAWVANKAWFRTPLLIDAMVGRQEGYRTAHDARIAAALLTRGPDPAAAIMRDADRRYRIYTTSSELPPSMGGGDFTFGLEDGMPRLPNGAVLYSWIWDGATDLVELRDGTRRIFPANS